MDMFLEKHKDVVFGVGGSGAIFRTYANWPNYPIVDWWNPIVIDGGFASGTCGFFHRNTHEATTKVDSQPKKRSSSLINI